MVSELAKVNARPLQLGSAASAATASTHLRRVLTARIIGTGRAASRGHAHCGARCSPHPRRRPAGPGAGCVRPKDGWRRPPRAAARGAPSSAAAVWTRRRRRGPRERRRGSSRWPRHRGRACGSARCRTGATGCRRRTRRGRRKPGSARGGAQAATAATVRSRSAQAHSVSSKLASLPAGRRRPSGSVFISRTDTINRWPLISGISSASSSRTRSNW